MRVVAKKINCPSCDYFTVGKIYDIRLSKRTNGYFLITDDTGYNINTSFRDDIHIGGNWTIIGNPAVVEVKS